MQEFEKIAIQKRTDCLLLRTNQLLNQSTIEKIEKRIEQKFGIPCIVIDGSFCEIIAIKK